MKWQADPAHTAVTFQVKHMGTFIVAGNFATIAGSVETTADCFPQSIQIEIDANSIQTGNDARNAHLLSGDFFDVEKSPKLSFQSTDITLKPVAFSLASLFGAKKVPMYLAKGNLNMRGVSHPVELEFEIPNAPFEDPWQAKRIGARGNTVIDRTKWGISWNQNVASIGMLLVSNDVKIGFNSQFTLVK
jgi:polyisoprenoid-binding protein YceI